MKIDIKVAALKDKIKQAIENEEFDKVEALSEELCKMQGLETKNDMPSDFIETLKRKERKQKNMRMQNKLVKAAAILLAIGVAGGTVYASSQYFKTAKHTGHGVVVSEDEKNVTFNSEEGIIAGDKTEETLSPEQKKAQDELRDEDIQEDKVEVLETAAPGADDLWISKKIKRITSYGKESDDGINWKDTSTIEMATDYEYKDFDTACEDNNMEKIFDRKYEQVGNTQYRYSEFPDEDGNVEEKSAVIDSKMKYNQGTVDVNYSKNFDSSNVDDRTLMVITGEEEVFNQREYTSKNGEKFTLSDNVNDGVTATTVILSHNEYDCILTFTDLSDDEIHEILDTVIIE